VYGVVVLTLDEAGEARAPVLALGDALASAGSVRTVNAGSDEEIDEVLAGSTRQPARTGWPGPAPRAGQVGGRRGRRRPGARRRAADGPAVRAAHHPDDLPFGRTIVSRRLGILRSDHPATATSPAARLPRDPAAVAAALLAGAAAARPAAHGRGHGHLDGTLLGGSDQAGGAVRWQARVEWTTRC
jgi:hypothetical protein